MPPARTLEAIIMFDEFLFNQVMADVDKTGLARRMNVEFRYWKGPTFMTAMREPSTTVLAQRQK
jgi:hypothetical protein